MLTSRAEIVRRESLAELRKLAGWFSAKHGVTIVLLGGWAVYSYNPYLGSFDIDCLGPKDPFMLHLNLYMNANGYVLEPESPFGAAAESWKKPVYQDDAKIDDIYIDACDFEFRNLFREDPSKEIPYNICLKKQFITRRQIDGEYFWVPIKELLFLYKAKAARDRQHLIAYETLPLEHLERLRGKVEKDHSDMTALLDQRFGGPLNGSILGDLIREYHLSLIAETISDLPRQPSVKEYAFKRQIDIDEIQQWSDKILLDSGIEQG